MIDPVRLLELMKSISPGHWAAVGRDSYELVGTATSSDAVMAIAASNGETDPLVFRIPRRSTSDGLWTAKTPLYGALATVIKTQDVVPLLGAGASLAGNHGDFQPEKPFYPSSRQLTEYLAQRMEFPLEELAQSDLGMVSAYTQIKGGRKVLKNLLREALGPLPNDTPRCQPGALHLFLAEYRRYFPMILTTNYDTLIEGAFKDYEHDVIIYPAEGSDWNGGLVQRWQTHGYEKIDLSQLTVKDFAKNIIFKVHGSLTSDRCSDGFVITEDDYLKFLSRMSDNTAVPQTIADYLKQHYLLFLGYGLHDWNVRLLVAQLQVEKAYAVQNRVKAVDELLWLSRNVDLYQEDLDVFTEELRRALGPPPVEAADE